jgi:formate dehydrogenase subunit beta
MPVGEGGALGNLRELLARLLQTGVVEAALVPLQTKDGLSVQPVLVTDPARLGEANPLLPVIPISAARMASLLTGRGPAPEESEADTPGRIAIVMRPCELRATIELAKLNQVRLERLLTIALDCVGTYEVTDWARERQAGLPSAEALLAAAREARPEAPDDTPYRAACTICETPVGWNADLAVHTIGVDTSSQILIEVADVRWLELLGLSASEDVAGRLEAVEGLRTTRRERRASTLDQAAERMRAIADGTPGIVVAFERCQRCGNCTVACPICYCKECLFRTDAFAAEPRRYLALSRRKGASRLPGDSVAFQLTRMCHVSTSCVGCGLCTSACPAGIPIDSYFQAVARRTQALFDYVPGAALDQPVPQTTFVRDEFVELGETEHAHVSARG